MATQAAPDSVLWPLALYCAVVIFLAAVIVGLSALLGQRHSERTTGEPYESGIAPTGSARIRFDIKFYLSAMFFVLFDLEAVFIFAWAIAARPLGWTGYLEILIFIIVLVLALFYLWRVGALDWRTAKHRICLIQDEKPPSG
ncbi:MAG: NADH-quinone oxidoreductase subunit A [Thermodesulfobacteriota bacterium]